MRIDRLVGPTMLALILCIAIPSMSFAGDGLFRRIAQQRNSKRSAQPVSHPTPRAATNISKSRLPSGRNYYQGRYYGNLNNRFYGPQYGYF